MVLTAHDCARRDAGSKSHRLEIYSVPPRRVVVGICPEAHDLCESKLVAFREKDLEFVGSLIDAAVVDAATLRCRLESVPNLDPLALN